MRRAALTGLVLVLAGGAGGSVVLSASGEEPARTKAVPRAAAQPKTVLPPLPSAAKARVVEPVAGALAQPSAAPRARARPRAAAPPPLAAPAPDRSATGSGAVRLARPATAGDGVRRATALPNGIALPPLEAPESVRQMIEAGNQIARTPYLWGGGHGKWVDTGYDCSGSVSFVLASAGYLDRPLASGPLMAWGEPGRGRWVTIFAHDGHVFMEVAGIRFDTSGARATGSRWQNGRRSTAGFVARHPPGL